MNQVFVLLTHLLLIWTTASVFVLDESLIVGVVGVPFNSTVDPPPTWLIDDQGCWYLNASYREITSIEPSDLDTYYNQFQQQPMCGRMTIDMSNNELVQLPVNLFIYPVFSQVILLSNNLFTPESISNFFSNDTTVPTVFTIPTASTGDYSQISLDLSSNAIGPLPPNIFQFMNVDKFVCHYCGLTSLPSGTFAGALIKGLDLSYNDFSSSGCIAPLVFDGLTTMSIKLNNCNLRTSSLPSYGLFHTSLYIPYDHRISLSLNNDPYPFTNFDNITSFSYFATSPNVFVDLNHTIFDAPNQVTGLHQIPVASIKLGDFVSFQGGASFFAFASWMYLKEISINLAPDVAVQTVVVPTWCPVQQLANAITGCFMAPTLTITAFGFNGPSILPADPSCTFPLVICVDTEVSQIFVSTEPGLLQRGLFKWFNSLVIGGVWQDWPGSITWIPPVIWNPSLNRSDWMPVDMLCDLTHFTILTLPGLPYPQFQFPPPDNMLACLTSTIYNIDWSQSQLFSSGMFGGRPDSAPNMNVAVDLKRLYSGILPVPVDFFTPLVGHSSNPLNYNFKNTSNPNRYVFDVCTTYQCHVFAESNIASGCPYFVNTVCSPCPPGYYPQTFPTNEYGPVTYCKSALAGTYVEAYTEPFQLPLPIPCPSGTYQPLLHQTSCLDCSPGTYNPLTGMNSPAACIFCPPGSANPNSGSRDLVSACQPCPIGTASPAPGVATCAACGLGYYQNATGSFQCEPCPSNTYRDRTGGISIDDCTPCPSQTPLSSPGTTSVFSCSTGTSCSDGYYTSILDSKPCQSLCAQGSYCVGGQITSCPPGSFSNTTGLSSCYACGPGWYSSVVGSTSDFQCLPCPLSTYSTAAVSSSCQPCWAGSISTVTGSSSANSCQLAPGCNLTSYNPLLDLIDFKSDLTYCQLGSVAPMPLNQLLPDGLTLMSAFATQLQPQLVYLYQNPTLTPSAATRAYRRYTTSNQAPSLRLADYSTDDQLTLHGATQPSADINSIGSGVGGGSSILTRSTSITILVIFLSIAFLSWPIYRRIPANLAFHFDQFNMNHHIHAGQSPVKQPTQFGSAVTWSFLWVSILTTIFLASASNKVTNTSLVPPSSIPYAGTARAVFQITIRAYSSNSSVSMFCDTWLLNTDQDGFNNFTFRTRPNADVCSIAADCLDCDLGSGSSSVAFTFPYDTQFFEWELFISSAAPNTWSRRYGVLSQLPGHLFDSQSELQFSVIESYYTDHTQSGDGTRQSGFELDFAQYASVKPQPVATFSPDSTVTIQFVLTKSDIMFDSYSTNKLSTFQLFVSILTAIVSLFTIFGIFFNKFERFILSLLCHQSSGELRKDSEGRIQLGHETSTNDVIKSNLSHTVNPLNSDSSVIGSSEVELEVNPASGTDGGNSVHQNCSDEPQMVHAL